MSVGRIHLRARDGSAACGSSSRQCVSKKSAQIVSCKRCKALVLVEEVGKGVAAAEREIAEREEQFTRILQAAAAHKRASEEEMEAGDLIAILSSCWKRLDGAERAAVLKAHSDVLAWGEDAEPPPAPDPTGAGWSSARHCKTGDEDCIHLECARCGATAVAFVGAFPTHRCPGKG